MDLDKKNEKLPLSWLTLGHFVNDIYTGMLNPIMPFIAAKLNFSMAIAAVIMSISQIFSSMLQPIFGFFADKILKRAFIFWGLILSAVFIPLSTTAPTPYILVVCIIFGSIGSSLFHPQALEFVSRFAKTDLAKTMGVFIGFGALGFSFGPILSAYVTQFFGLEKMPILSVFGIIFALLMFKCVPKLSNTVSVKSNIKFKKAFYDILHNRKLIILIVIAMLKSLITNSTAILLPFLWKEMGYPPFYIGAALFGFIFAGGIGSILSRNLERKIGSKYVFYFSMISTLPLMFIFVMTYQTIPWLSIVAFVLMGLFTMMAIPVTMVMAQSILPEYKSIISGFINGFSWGVIAVCMSLIGFLAQSYGITKILMIIAFIPAVCSFIVKYLYIPNKKPL